MSSVSPNQDWRVYALLVGGGVLVIVAALLIGFQIGSKKEKQKQANEDASAVEPVGTGITGRNATAGVRDPLSQGPAQTPGSRQPTESSLPAGGGVIRGPGEVSAPSRHAEVALQDGWNYLVVATLRRPEAEIAAQYLADNKISVKLMPVDGSAVDRGGGGANNARWQLWVLQGVPRGEYSKRLTERQALERQVQSLGRLWKAKNRSVPTDFGDVYWTAYKAPMN